MFIKHPFKQRLYQTCIEMNLAKKVFPYFPDQTMSATELDTLKRMCGAVYSLQRDGEIVNMDFDKWNTRFRHNLVAQFGRLIDQLSTKKVIEENPGLD